MRDVCLALRRACQGRVWPGGQAGRQPGASSFQRQLCAPRPIRPDEHLRSGPGLTPLIRVGKRGEGLFRKASWEEALDLVAENMLKIKDKYGPEAMIFSSTHNLSQVQFENLLNAFGSPNYGTQRSLCFNAMIVANLITYGMEEPGRKYDDLKYIILTGRNLMEAISTSETSALKRGHRSRRQGGLSGSSFYENRLRKPPSGCPSVRARTWLSTWRS